MPAGSQYKDFITGCADEWDKVRGTRTVEAALYTELRQYCSRLILISASDLAASTAENSSAGSTCHLTVSPRLGFLYRTWACDPGKHIASASLVAAKTCHATDLTAAVNAWPLKDGSRSTWPAQQIFARPPSPQTMRRACL